MALISLKNHRKGLGNSVLNVKNGRVRHRHGVFNCPLLKGPAVCVSKCQEDDSEPHGRKSESSLIVVRRSCITTTLIWSTTSSFLDVEDLTRTSFTFHWYTAIFETDVQLLYLRGVHCFFPGSLFKLSDHFHLGISKLHTKFNAIELQVLLPFCQNRKSASAHLHSLTHRRSADNWLLLQAGKTIRYAQ